MKIYSKFKDYYDVALAYGQDPLCVWNREREETPFREIGDKFSYEKYFKSSNYDTAPLLIEPWRYSTHIGYHNNILHIDEGYIMFCGKLYPYLKLVKGYKDEECFYDIDSFEKKMILFGLKEWLDTKSRRARSGSRYKWFKEFLGQSLDCTDVHMKNKQPIFIIDICNVITGGLLKDYDFIKVFDPYACLQEIEMFISGTLGGQAPEMVVTSDVTRLEAKGFDRKTSFRHRK